MDTKVIPLSDLKADPEGVLRECFDSGRTLVVELPDQRLVAIQPVAPDDALVDELIAGNAKFQQVLARSLASPREPFPFTSH